MDYTQNVTDIGATLQQIAHNHMFFRREEFVMNHQAAVTICTFMAIARLLPQIEYHARTETIRTGEAMEWVEGVKRFINSWLEQGGEQDFVLAKQYLEAEKRDMDGLILSTSAKESRRH